MQHDPTRGQDIAIRRRLGGDMFLRSAFYRERLRRAGLVKDSIQGRGDLRLLPVMQLDDISTSSTLLLDPPKPTDNKKDGRRYWPVQWVRAADGVPLGYSFDDLILLRDAGEQVLTAGGVTAADVVVNLLPSATARDYWQVVLGAQHLGASLFNAPHDSEPQYIETFSPSVLVATSTTLMAMFDALMLHPGFLARLHTVIVVGNMDDKAHVLGRLGIESAIVQMWAPDGVLAAWGQCRSGVGLHTYPDNEVLEVVDPISGLSHTSTDQPGALLWTGIGWYASAIVRLHTGALARVNVEPCPACGRTSPRIEEVRDVEGFPGLLDGSPLVGSWFAEVQRTENGDRLALWVAQSPAATSYAVMGYLGEVFPDAVVSIVDSAEVDHRRSAANGERVVDRRAVIEDAEE